MKEHQIPLMPEHLDLKVYEDLMSKRNNIIQRLSDEVRRQETELFTTALRTRANPPIKREVTKGKIQWRGIKLIRKQVGLDSYSWLEQRGERISQKFHVKAKLL